MKFNKTVLSTLIVLGLSQPVFAGDLTIDNKSSADSTCLVNGGGCSQDFLGELGVTRAGGEPKTLPHRIIKAACAGSPTHCSALVYAAEHCKGAPIANVVLDVNKGIVSISPTETANGFKVAGTGFNVKITGGPNKVGFMHWFFS